MYVQNASVCTVRTSPCVPATGPNVLDIRACCRYTRRRPDRTHGGVLNVHTGGFSACQASPTPHVHTQKNNTPHTPQTHTHAPPTQPHVHDNTPTRHNHTQHHMHTPTRHNHTQHHMHTQHTQNNTSHTPQHIFIKNCNNCNACNVCNFDADLLFSI